ncbi:DUF6072 family protein [Nitrospirillum iridis]|uniref:Uncharacterized protein n=1 Tax=Nitrospirillum iridis TaxID=765888 RepID=A0A7X0EGX5_9PROT|nr:DUF6072 family protein [Nitrospirillum iridis]MBB6254536.1 hypothetical protein [Nitrospirillum iridis]
MAKVETDQIDVLGNTALLAGEIVVPGASDMIAGNIASGAGTLLASGLVAAVIAPSMPLIGILAAVGLRINSFRHATTGQHVWSNVRMRRSGVFVEKA